MIKAFDFRTKFFVSHISTMCGWTDPEDENEEEITLKGRELVIFTILYTIAVITLFLGFEIIMPVINNPSYPFYNKHLDFTYDNNNNT